MPRNDNQYTNNNTSSFPVYQQYFNPQQSYNNNTNAQNQQTIHAHHDQTGQYNNAPLNTNLNNTHGRVSYRS